MVFGERETKFFFYGQIDDISFNRVMNGNIVRVFPCLLRWRLKKKHGAVKSFGSVWRKFMEIG